MRSGAERRGSSAAAPPGSPPPSRARPCGPDAPPAPPPPAAGQPRARDTGDARAQPRPLFPWSKWKKRMGSSMSAATARRPVFDDKEDGELGRRAGALGRSLGQRGDPCLMRTLQALAAGPRRQDFLASRHRDHQGGKASRGVSVSEETRGWCLRCPRASRASACVLRVQWRRSGGLSRLRRPCGVRVHGQSGPGLAAAACFHFLFRFCVQAWSTLHLGCAAFAKEDACPTGGLGSLALGDLSLRMTVWRGSHMLNLCAQMCSGDGFAFVQRPALWKVPLRVSSQVLLQVKLLTQTAHWCLLSVHARQAPSENR